MIEDPATAMAVRLMVAHGGGASTAQLAGWGIPRAAVDRMVRRGVIVRQARGRFRLPTPTGGDPWAIRRTEHLMAAAAVIGTDAVLALRTAALARRLPVAAFPDLVELRRPPGSRHPSGTRVVRGVLDPSSVQSVNGVRVTSLERTAVDIALDLPTPEALVTVDAALRRGADREVMGQMLAESQGVRGRRRALRTMKWADGHSESALESRGRGELMVRGAPRPWCNVTFRMGDVEFRLDQWWPDLGFGGEADGALKYSSDEEAVDRRTLWREKLRQEWFEDEIGLPILRYIDREVRLAPDALYARFVRKSVRGGGQLWVPPAGLEVFQRPVAGSGAPVRWFHHRGDG